MKRTSFENLYDEYESQRRDELRFILEDTNPRIPYTPQQKENKTMKQAIILHYDTGMTYVYNRNDLSLIDEIITDRILITEISTGVLMSEKINDEEEVILLEWEDGTYHVYSRNDEKLIDALIEDFDLITETYTAKYYKHVSKL